MTGLDPEMPWLPADAGQDFDPLAHAGVEPSMETPMVVTPRGGARQVGRSCYQVDTEHSTYLVDCGLSQGGDDKFPDFRGLQPGQVDAVFLTHAHIDHCGGLPVLEAGGFLDDDAPIVATAPTIDLARLLLEDSLGIHLDETQRPGRKQRFEQKHVDAIFERFESVDYGGARAHAVAPDAVPPEETLMFQFGNAAHLLGSAWLLLQTEGYRVVFSGDIGNRATHLPDLQSPPEAHLLLLESTYGAQHSHTSMGDARSELFKSVEDAVENRQPVLIPTFAVGRAQLLQLLFTERLTTHPGDLAEKARLVVDGMAQEATDIYHEYVDDETYMDESIVNRVRESGWTDPFLPEGTVFPESDADRRDILTDWDPLSGGRVPIILSPSGMLTGGNSPRYLTEFAARYDDAKIILTGYQAQSTTGRSIQNQLKTDPEELTFTVDTNPLGTDWPTSPNVAWTRVETDNGSERVTRATIPAEWIETADGLSGHAAQHGLRGFARDVRASNIALIHGPDFAQDTLGRHLAQNIDDVEQVTRSRLLTPIPVSRDIELSTPTLTPEHFEGGTDRLRNHVEKLHEEISALHDELAALRERSYTEAEVRQIVRDELKQEQDE